MRPGTRTRSPEAEKKMRTVKEIVAELSRFPEGSWVYSYEDGLVVVDPVVCDDRVGHEQLGVIDTPEDWPDLKR